ncbi:MAG: glycosyltransferase family 4 protein [Candidatus Omnitrophota bacterium]
MRIFILTASYLPVLGGLQNAAHTLARALMHQGHVVEVVTNRYPRSLPQHEVIEGVPVSRLLFLSPDFRHLLNGRIDLFAASWYFYPQTLSRLTMLIQNFKPDVVNIHFPDAQIPFVLQAHKKIKFKLIVSLHGDEIARFYLAHRRGRNIVALRNILDAADAITACSDFLLKNALQLYPVVAHKAYVTYNGIEPEAFHDKAPYVHARPYLLAYARFTHNKGLDVLIEAFTRVARSNPHIDLIIAGEGEDEIILHHLVNRLGLNDRIHFVGRANAAQVVQLLNGCEFVVVSSRHETFNLTIIEAFAVGKTVVATRSGGPEEIIEHGVSGLLVENDDSQALAEALITLLKDTALRNTMVQNATRSLSRFTATAMAARYVHIFQGTPDAPEKENQPDTGSNTTYEQ